MVRPACADGVGLRERWAEARSSPASPWNCEVLHKKTRGDTGLKVVDSADEMTSIAHP
jgi:hypothetical protein